METWLESLRYVEPVHTLRDTMEYSNSAWSVAGEVLRAAAGSSTWCDGLHKTLITPLNLSRTFCHRNEIPDEVAAKHLAAVHKHAPCHGNRTALSTFDFVSTGGPRDFAWGAADAAGMSCACTRSFHLDDSYCARVS